MGTRQIDEEIARLRGWGTSIADGLIAWRPPPTAPEAEAWEQITGCGAQGCGDTLASPRWSPPPFSSSWALAGPLLEEIPLPDLMAHDDVWVCCTDTNGRPGMSIARGATPCEAIARAWLAWKRGSP